MHIYCGDGKGKTTAAVGLCTRAAGNGLNVLFVQFLKSWPTGEIAVFEKLPNVTVLRSKKPFPFTDKMTDAQKKEITDIHNGLLADAVKIYDKGGCDLLVLDEIISTYNYEFVDKSAVDVLLARHKALKKGTELVITGRNPNEDFINMADYVSEVKKIKHPFDVGIMARKGIED